MFSILAALITLGGFVNAQGYLSMPLTERSLDEENTSLYKREISGLLSDERTHFTVSFALGDDQKQACVIDTASSGIWVFSDQTPAQYKYNPSGGKFLSNTFKKTHSDGTKAEGSYYKDKLTFDGVTVDAQFGVSDLYEDNSRWGRFGLGPKPPVEGCEGPAPEDSYPWVLKNQRKIETAAYSLTMQKGSVGEVLFGAVDVSRYTGKLQLLENKGSGEFAVEFSVAGIPHVGILDSGSRHIYLPDHIVSSFVDTLGAKFNPDSKSYYMEFLPGRITLEFNFNGTEVVLDTNDLLSPSDQFHTTFVLSVRPNSQVNGKIILGEPFLQAAYTVYDLEKNQVAIAQAGSPSASGIKPITSDGIPGASW